MINARGGRRSFLKASMSMYVAGLASTVGSSARAGMLSTNPAKPDLFVVDGLGALFDINAWAGGEPLKLVYPEDMIRDLRTSGLACLRLTTGSIAQPDEGAFEQAMLRLARSQFIISRNHEVLELVRSVDDIFDARRNNKIGVTLTVQNCHAIGDDLRRVSTFFGLGVQTFQVTYNDQNQFGAGSSAAEDLPLTKLGHQLVEAINQLGAIVDLSHSNRQTCLDAIAVSNSPTIISHSGCRALSDIPRNKTDKEMRAIADSGGTFGIYFMPFLAEDGQATSEHLIAHIEHALDVCGEDHVSIGTDGTYGTIDDMDKVRARYREFTQRRIEEGTAAKGEFLDNVNLIPDIAGANQFALLAEKLLMRGHSQDRVDKLLGKNELRVMGEVWSRQPF